MWYMKMVDVLASFEVRVMGVRLNDVPRGCCTIGTAVEFRRDPRNPYDKLRRCVSVRSEVRTRGQDSGSLDV